MNKPPLPATAVPAAKPRPENWRYEATAAEIERIVNRIEMGELELEDVFEQFAQATEYLQQCEAFLNERQAQVNVLIETLGDSFGSQRSV
jgi:exodeoxyribonuclease VII small subunit